MHGRKLKKTRIFSWAVALIFIPMLSLGSLRWLLPDEITMVEGENTQISLQLPISMKTEESVGVLGITTKPLADAFHLGVGSAITATPLESGETKVTFYLCDTVPIKTVNATVLPKTELVPVGKTVGVNLDTKGLLVLGTGTVDIEGNEDAEPCKGILRAGDLILEADGQELSNKEKLQEAVKESEGGKMALLIERNGAEKTVAVAPARSVGQDAYMLGVWVRDSIQGIGTVTFYDPNTRLFGALGHGVYDVDTGERMIIKNGSIVEAELGEIVKGKKGEPGELTGSIRRERAYGEIKSNTEVGIYGFLEDTSFLEGAEAIPIALRQEVEEGSATILSNIKDGVTMAFDIEIEHVEKGGEKNMVVCITDEWLLENTGGIVQGMSGSPIIQNGKLVGAVTHVLINDPQRGYGTYIETMLQEGNKIV